MYKNNAYCIDCGHILNVFSGAQDDLACVNEECSRYGLCTFKNSETPESGRATGEYQFVSRVILRSGKHNLAIRLPDEMQQIVKRGDIYQVSIKRIAEPKA